MTLRPMTMDDADFMLELKNDPDTRRFAISTQEEIQKEDHYAWLEKHIGEFQVIEEVGGHMIGAIRIQDVTPINVLSLVRMHPTLELSIWIAKRYRNCGWGELAIKRVRRHAMRAKIVVSNVASQRAFIKAEFRPTELVDNKYFVYQYIAPMYGTT